MSRRIEATFALFSLSYSASVPQCKTSRPPVLQSTAMKQLSALLSLCVVAAMAPGGDAASRPSIDGAAFLEHIKVLASDRYAGRAPGGPGESLTVAYLEDQFRRMGLGPGNTDGTYVQTVPLVSITAAPDAHLTLQRGGESRVL